MKKCEKQIYELLIFSFVNQLIWPNRIMKNTNILDGIQKKVLIFLATNVPFFDLADDDTLNSN